MVVLGTVCLAEPSWWPCSQLAPALERQLVHFFIFYMVICFSNNIKVYLHFLSFQIFEMAQVVESIAYRRPERCILHNQYCGCWLPGDLMSQAISSHGIDLFLLEYSALNTRRFVMSIQEGLIITLLIFSKMLWQWQWQWQWIYIWLPCIHRSYMPHK